MHHNFILFSVLYSMANVNNFDSFSEQISWKPTLESYADKRIFSYMYNMRRPTFIAVMYTPMGAANTTVSSRTNNRAG